MTPQDTPGTEQVRDEERPTHAWNDPDGDGHDCVDCHPESIWKCDRNAHPGESVLPPLTPIPGLENFDPDDLLTDEDKRSYSEWAEQYRITQIKAMGDDQLC